MFITSSMLLAWTVKVKVLLPTNREKNCNLGLQTILYLPFFIIIKRLYSNQTRFIGTGFIGVLVVSLIPFLDQKRKGTDRIYGQVMRTMKPRFNQYM